VSRTTRHRREVGVSGTAVGCRGAVPASWGGRGGRSAGGVTTAQPRASSGAQQGRAADCLQPPLLRRCGFRQQLTPSVRLPLFCKLCTEGGLSRADGFPYDVSRTSVPFHPWIGTKRPGAVGQLRGGHTRMSK